MRIDTSRGNPESSGRAQLGGAAADLAQARIRRQFAERLVIIAELLKKLGRVDGRRLDLAGLPRVQHAECLVGLTVLVRSRRLRRLQHGRSEERRVGKECDRTGKAQGTQVSLKQN